MWKILFVFFLSGLSAGLQAGRQATYKKNKYNLPRIHLLPPDDGLKMGPKHVEAWQFNKEGKGFPIQAYGAQRVLGG
jgi:hypothetical protein